MFRVLYRALLALHPSEFREEFAGEMLWIFDETTTAEGYLGSLAPLFADVLTSLFRQWVIGYQLWRVAFGAAYWLAFLVLVIGMLASPTLARPH